MNQKRILVTAALPYVNNEPHLGNLTGSLLSADVFARYMRLQGAEVLFVCGTDEYGTATEMKAREMGETPEAICASFHSLHKKIYDWFQISTDVFGRTATAEHNSQVQDIYQSLKEVVPFLEKSEKHAFDPQLGRFLADRFIVGTCGFCGALDAHGDQCDRCGRLMDETSLINPRSKLTNTALEKKASTHLYLNLPALEPQLREWRETKKHWKGPAKSITDGWLEQGLKARSMTRDLNWGVPVPDYPNKVFYVWFDAPIGYISMTKSARQDWKIWWQNPDQVELVQFMGKDNVPFHSIFFPSVLLGTRAPWTLVHSIHATEYLNYEGGKFSKSKKLGVFGSDAMKSGIASDAWRYYLMSIRPERQDSSFTWQDFEARVNHELLANFGNLANRVLQFLSKSGIHAHPKKSGPSSETEIALLETFQREAVRYQHLLRDGQLRDALALAMMLARECNRFLQDEAPWKTIKTDRDLGLRTLAVCLERLRDLAILFAPYIPTMAAHLTQQLGLEPLTWKDLHMPIPEGLPLPKPEPLVQPIDLSQRDSSSAQ